MMSGPREVQYLVLPDAANPYLLARVRWPDVCQAISPVRPDWQDDPGLFDLPYDSNSVPVSRDQAALIATHWESRLPADAVVGTFEFPLMRRMPANWSNLSRAEKRAWSIDAMDTRPLATPADEVPFRPPVPAPSARNARNARNARRRWSWRRTRRPRPALPARPALEPPPLRPSPLVTDLTRSSAAVAEPDNTTVFLDPRPAENTTVFLDSRPSEPTTVYVDPQPAENTTVFLDPRPADDARAIHRGGWFDGLRPLLDDTVIDLTNEDVPTPVEER
jgi:hypothetical protein